MKMFNKGLALVAGAAFFASAATAQDFVVESVTINNAGGTVDVDWSYTAGGGVSGIGIDITAADPALVTGFDLTNCGAGATSPIFFCNDIGGGTFRITSAELSAATQLGNQSGTITYTVAAGADGDSSVLDAVQADSSPIGSVINITDGAIALVATTAILNVTPGNINFGNQQTGTSSAPQAVTVSNDGTDGVDLTISAINFTGDFAQTGGTCTGTDVLADGTSCTIDVTFTPSADGAAAGSAVVVSDAGAVTNDTTTLDGVGTPGPVAAFSITPPTATFGVVDLGNMPQSIVHTVENTGDVGSTLDLNTVAYAGDAEFSISATTCGASLAAGATCTVTVTFDAAANGVYTGSVNVSTNVGDFSVPVSGEADSVATLSVNPPFGPVDLGNGTSGSTITANGQLSNTGSADGAFSCVLGGPDAAVFSTTPAPLAGTVAAGDTEPFSLSCAIPATAVDGDTFNATLTCTSADDPNFNGTHELSCGALNVPMIPVPTMQPWALVLFSMLMLIAGGLGIRFFRAS